MIKEIAEMKNEILVEWLESKDTGKRNRVVVKHVVDKTKSMPAKSYLCASLHAQSRKCSFPPPPRNA